MGARQKKMIEAPPEDDKAFGLWVLLQQARDAVYNARNKELTKYGISPREAATLRAIYVMGEGVTPAMLSRWVYRKPPTVMGILRRMQKKGLLKLNKDTQISNIVRIALTNKGKQAYEDAMTRESIHQTFNLIVKENTEQLESFLIKIRDSALAQTGDVIQRLFP